MKNTIVGCCCAIVALFVSALSCYLFARMNDPTDFTCCGPNSCSWKTYTPSNIERNDWRCTLKAAVSNVPQQCSYDIQNFTRLRKTDVPSYAYDLKPTDMYSSCRGTSGTNPRVRWLIAASVILVILVCVFPFCQYFQLEFFSSTYLDYFFASVVLCGLASVGVAMWVFQLESTVETLGNPSQKYSFRNTSISNQSNLVYLAEIPLYYNVSGVNASMVSSPSYRPLIVSVKAEVGQKLLKILSVALGSTNVVLSVLSVTYMHLVAKGSKSTETTSKGTTQDPPVVPSDVELSMSGPDVAASISYPPAPPHFQGHGSGAGANPAFSKPDASYQLYGSGISPPTSPKISKPVNPLNAAFL
eukprot:PhF_6_TR9942/c0_g2_i1/m.15125